MQKCHHNCRPEKAIVKCSGCSDSFYCSQQCQEKYWILGYYKECHLLNRFIGDINLKENITITPSERLGSPITLTKPISTGSVGQVWSAVQNKNPVIVKIFDLVSFKGLGRREFIREVYIHKILKQKQKSICDKNARCGTISFKYEELNAGVIVFDQIEKEPVDLGKFVETTLADLKKKDQKLARRVIVKIAQDVVDDIASFHENGIAHRDIKLQNILVDNDVVTHFDDNGFKSVLIDFNSSMPFEHDIDIFKSKSTTLTGINRLLTKEESDVLGKGRLPNFVTQTPTPVGTPVYIDPQSYLNVWIFNDLEYTKDIMTAMDIFATGITLFFIEAGQKIVRDIFQQDFNEQILWKPDEKDIGGLLLSNIIKQMLVDDPSKRVKKSLREYTKDLKKLKL